ncbi:hypothetical protein EDD86DRAFT_204601 [Gorgonomyces haynaldii]|nr:hypothetical protein EDD86DRAFT_204601 [Gorgonomyces haynaldii]
MSDILKGTPKPVSVAPVETQVQENDVAPSVERVEGRKGVIDYSKWEKFQDTDEPPQETPKPVAVKKHDTHGAHIQSLKDKGNEYFGQKQYQKAIQSYTEAIDYCMNPIKPNKGSELFGLLEKIKPLPLPVPPSLYSNRAICHYLLNDFGACLLDCDAAIASDPTLAKPYWYKSLSHAKQQEYQQALDPLLYIKSNSVKGIVDWKDLELKVQLYQDKINDLSKQLPEDSALVIELFERLLDTKDRKIIQAFFKTPEMQDIFRVQGGFDLILKLQNTPDLLLETLELACQSKENQRLLTTRINEYMALVSKASKAQLLGFLLWMVKSEPLHSILRTKHSWTHLATTALQQPAIKILDWLEWMAVQEQNLIEIYQLPLDRILLELPANERSLKCLFEFSRHPHFVNDIKKSAQDLCTKLFKQLPSKDIVLSELLTKSLYNVLITDPSIQLDCKHLRYLHEDLLDLTNLRLVVQFTKRDPRYFAIVDKTVWQSIWQAGLQHIEEAVQLTTLLLQQDPTRLDSFKSQLGFEGLVQILKEHTNQPSLKLIGNTALALSICATDVKNCVKLNKLGAMEHVILHMRTIKDPVVRKNLGICCAKLCQDEAGRVKAREMRALEILSTLHQ